MRFVILGLSITSSWGNGHATTYRALVRELAALGHSVLFLERDTPWYAEHRDLQDYPHAQIRLYESLEELRQAYAEDVRTADAVIVGSYVPDGTTAGEWVLAHAEGVTAFYDIDTPVTLAKLDRGEAQYISAELIPRYQVYLSFTGGETLRRLEHEYGSPCARALYCAIDPTAYYPESAEKKWDLGYLGTYCPDRQPGLERLLLLPARRWPQGRFLVAGPQYPATHEWPENVSHTEHLPPTHHRAFYNAQRFTLNLTRAEMVRAGHSPSVRLFEAAACATPIISDYWPGLEAFFQPDSEILVARSGDDVRRLLQELPESERQAIGERARARFLAGHTARHRAIELEEIISGCAREKRAPAASMLQEALL